MGLEQITSAVVDLSVISATVIIIILTIVLSRRRHVTIAEVSNGTGRTDLDRYMDGVSAEFRLAVGREMGNTVETVHRYHEKVLGDVADRCYAPDLPEMRDALINRQDDTLDRLAASLENGSAKSFAAQLQSLGGAVARPRGATVTATIYQQEADGARLGIAVEVVSPASHFAQRHLLWETRKPARKETIPARIDTLLKPAARCAAIELAAWVLQRRPRRFSLRHRSRLQLPRRSRWQEGLARNMAGLLMNASAENFNDFAERFHEFALDEFKAAVTLLPKEYQPHYNLAKANEAAGRAASNGNEHYKFFAAAVGEYAEAATASEKLSVQGRADVLRKIEIGRLHAELVSDITRLRKNALKTLAARRPDVAADWPAGNAGKSRRRTAGGRGTARSTLDDAAAECLYNSACVYALAADATDRDYRTIRDDRDRTIRDGWDRQARRLLGAALVRDGSHRYLWHRAGEDRDLRRLAYHLDEFMARLRDSLVDDHPGPEEIDKIVKMVDTAGAESGWVARDSMSARRPGGAWAGALRRMRPARPVRHDAGGNGSPTDSGNFCGTLERGPSALPDGTFAQG